MGIMTNRCACAPPVDFMKAAEPLAAALKAQLAQIGIKPVVDCDNEQVVISRQAQADIEYLFAVNATYDATASSR